MYLEETLKPWVYFYIGYFYILSVNSCL